MSATQIPDDKTLAALYRAREAKLKRPLLLAKMQTPDVAANCRYAADCCEDVPELLGGMSVLVFLSGVEGVDFETAEAWMKAAAINPLLTMAGLGESGGAMLAKALRVLAEEEEAK